MQMTDQARTSDWYLYQNYTELRVYGCELAPYKLPKFLPMRIFALEYIKQMINADEVHFLAAKKKSQFRIKSQIGPFICNSRAAGEEEDKRLKEMNFTHNFTPSYDPWGIISKKRVKNKSRTYIYTQRPEIEKYMNHIESMPDTLQEVEEQVISSSSAQTPR